MSRDLNDGVDDDEITYEPMTQYKTTPDGRPYILAPPGCRFLATPRGGYVEVEDRILRTEFGRLWPDVPLTRQTNDGRTEKINLYEAYGCRVDELFYTYTGSTRFKPGRDEGGALYYRVVDKPPPHPRRHEDVLEWLRLLCGDSTEKVLDWLATAPILDRPTCALMLRGPKSLGKSMIAHGLSRYFGANATSFDDVFKGRFNDAMLRSPVIWCDEQATVAAPSAEFRRILGNSSHPIEAKFKATATLLGCPRLIVTANNPDPLRLSKEDLTTEDEEAIGERILIVDCDERAGGYLAKLGGREYTRDWVIRGDDDPGKVPELIAWLHENRRVQHGHRFLVHGDASAWAAELGTRAGLAATTLDAIAAYVNSKRAADSRYPVPRPAWFDAAHPDHILVSNDHLRREWADLTGEQRAPSASALSRALSRLAGYNVADRRETLADGTRVRAALIPRRSLGNRLD